MIPVLGIGGTFQIGFQVSTITYTSQVGKDARGTLINGDTESTFLLRMLLSSSQQGFNHSILLSWFFPITMLSCKAEHAKVLKIEEKRDLQAVVYRLFLRRHTLTGVASVFPINLQHMCLLQWSHLTLFFTTGPSLSSSDFKDKKTRNEFLLMAKWTHHTLLHCVC